MKLSNAHIAMLIETIEGIKDKCMPIAVGVIISANYEVLTTYTRIYTQAREVIATKHASIDESGEIVKTVDDEGKELIKIGDMEQFQKEMKELNEVVFDVAVTKIPSCEIEKFGEGKYDALTLKEIDGIKLLIEEEEQDDDTK